MTDSPVLSTFSTILDLPMISRIRRNHGLEHATIHILSRQHPKTSMAGYSDMHGFWIIGDVTPEALRSAAQEALTRLNNGEKQLALHPNCGTNFATSGIIAGLAASLAMFGAGSQLKSKLERIPFAMTLATLGLILAQPLGMKIQRHVTTSGDPAGLQIGEIQESQRGRVKAFRVLTQG